MKKRYLIIFLTILLFSKSGFSAELIRPETVPLLAVLEFKSNNAEEAMQKTVQENIIEHILQTQKYRVEQNETLKKIIKEMTLTIADLTDTAKIVLLGKKLAAKGVIIGTISLENNKYHIKAQLVDIKEGDIVKTEEISFSKQEHLSLACKIIAYKLINLEIAETIPADEQPVSEEKKESFNINLTFFENAIAYLGVQYRFFWLVSAGLRFGYAVHKNEEGYYLSGLPIVLDVSFYPFKNLNNFQPYATLGLIYLIGSSKVKSGLGFLAQVGCDIRIVDKLYAFGDAGIIISNKSVLLNIGLGVKYYLF